MVHRSMLPSRYLSNDSTGSSSLPEVAGKTRAVRCTKIALNRLCPVPAQTLTVPHLRYRSSSQDVNAAPTRPAAGRRHGPEACRGGASRPPGGCGRGHGTAPLRLYFDMARDPARAPHPNRAEPPER